MGKITLQVAQIVNTLHKGDNKDGDGGSGGGCGSGGGGGDDNKKLPETSLSFSVMPFVG